MAYLKLRVYNLVTFYVCIEERRIIMKKNTGYKLMASAIALGTVSSLMGTGVVKADNIFVQDSSKGPGYYQVDQSKAEFGNGTLAKDPSKGPGYYASSEIKANPIKGIVKINYVPGYGVALWNSPLNGSTIPGRYLAHGTSWKVSGVTTVNGETWYNLGGKQWVSGKYAQLTGTQVNKPTNPSTESKPTDNDNKAGMVLTNSVLKVTNPNGIQVWNSPDAGNKLTGQKLAPNTSWKSFAQYNNGILWLKLGANQWVKGYEATLGENNKPSTPNKPIDNPNTSGKILVKKIVEINYKPGYGIAVWSSPNNGHAIKGKYLPHGSRWKVSAMLNNGFLWYQVGTNQWIQAQYVK